MSEWVSPDAMSGAAHHIEREYGYGYRMRTNSDGSFDVMSSDGSYFRIAVGRYGEDARRLCDLGRCSETGVYRPYRSDYVCDSHAAAAGPRVAVA